MKEIKSWDSSMIDTTEYDIENQELTIIFKNKASYKYEGISEKLYMKFSKASSKGKFFLKNIRNKSFTSTKLDSDGKSI